jgi:ferritin-like metal-binding protein YciE
MVFVMPNGVLAQGIHPQSPAPRSAHAGVKKRQSNEPCAINLRLAENSFHIRSKEKTMTMNTLQDVYHDQLQDLHSACAQSLDATTKLGRAASNKDLSEALISGAQGISDGLDMLKSLCAQNDISPTGEHCKGMEGLVAEAHAHALDAEFSNDDVRDAMIITQYQRMVHYALAGYGCLVAFANRIGKDQEAAQLQTMLDHTYNGDRHMTEIATNGGVNKAAV